MTDDPNARPQTVKAYLEELARCLAGAPPGLIRDALNDAEDYLRGALAQNPEADEATVMARVIAEFGTPEEVAGEYLRLDHAIAAGPFPAPLTERPERGFLSRFFGVIAEPRAYGALLYMLLSLATGIFYFTWAVTGFTLSVSMLILIIGVPLALLFIASIRVLAWMEGRIVEALLGVRMPRRLPPTPHERTFWARIKTAVTDLRTWSSLAYLVLHLGFGMIYFTAAVTALTISLSFIAAPFVYAYFGSLVTINGDPGSNGSGLEPALEPAAGAAPVAFDDGTLAGQAINALLRASFDPDYSIAAGTMLPWLRDTLGPWPSVILLMVTGILLLIVTLHAARAIGWLHGKIAEALLVRV
jgi:hypothetical protein